ncbi:adenosylcobalamin-dependent ribonucleoside-diphosphate reductase [Patescibacteria group bacterium]|nr:adenosylcobalamin-dependent ribonucleoside-diphosphate reductase [Patescibacteria group bacterium]
MEKIINQIKKIQKRDKTIANFNQSKITDAILKAGQSVEEYNSKESIMLSNKVVDMLNKVYKDRQACPTVEEVQDIVEIVLMKQGFIKAAKSYIIYRQEHNKIRKIKKEILSGKTTKLPISLNSLRVLADRYLLKDIYYEKIVESPEEMFKRIAKALAGVEKKYKKTKTEIKKFEKDFYNIISRFEFLPAGRTIANAGTSLPIVSNCIVLHIEDSMKGIFSSLRDASLLQQSGSGIGFPFHMLRPAGNIAKRTKGVASGPVSFLRVYNEAFGVIKQQGRHGANMAVMRVDHPDILDFIKCKSIEGDIKNFNISISLTDKFMKQVESKSTKPWICKFNGKRMKPRKIIRDKHGVVLEIKQIEITAKDIMEEIVESAWTNGEPGVIFIDEVNRTNKLPGIGRIEACNPCGEQFIHDRDVCNLGSINLDKFVKNEEIEWDRLKEVVMAAVRMLDNVIDLTTFSVKKINNIFKKNRRIGLGIMGFSDMLFQLNLPYNSKAGRGVAEKVMKFINKQAHLMSEQLAKEKGVFSNYDLSVYKNTGIKMRNTALTTIAPTGSTSMLCDCSSGLEPYFALSYTKEVMKGQKLHYTNKHLTKKLMQKDIYTEELAQEIVEKGSIQNIKGIPKNIKDVFVGSMDIAPIDHVKMQASFQKYVDNSISKTVNLPNRATLADVLDIYLLAWKSKCKSCTVYRSGSRKSEVLTLLKKSQPKINQIKNSSGKFCPDCGSQLLSQEGCFSCPNCGFGLCSS